MSALKAAILRTQQQPAINQGSTTGQGASAAHPAVVGHTKTQWKPPSQGTSFPQQLALIRRRFATQVQHTSRFEQGQQLARWGCSVAGMSRRFRQRTEESGQVQEGWDAGLCGDLEAVAHEAGLPASVLPAVLSAASRGVVTSNPGVLLCQLLRFQSCLDSHLGHRQMMCVLRVYPALLNASPDTLSWHMEELCEIFGTDKAADMVVRQPMLLLSTPFAVWSVLETLRTLLDTSIPHAQRLAARQPRLLLNPPSVLRSRFTDLQQVTCLPPACLTQLCCSQPALLTYHPATLAHNLDCMAHTMDLELSQVVRLIRKAPALLMLNHDTLSRKLDGLAHVFKCDKYEAANLVLKQPSILGLSTDLVSHKCEHLAHVFGISAPDTLALLTSQPALLTLATHTVQRKLAVLQSMLDVPVPADRTLPGQSNATHTSQLASPDPRPDHEQLASTERLEGSQGLQAVATCSSVVSDSWLGLIRGSGSCAHEDLGLLLRQAWSDQLLAAPVRSRAVYACFSEQRYTRLHTLATLVHQASLAAADAGPQAWEQWAGEVKQAAGKRWALSRMLRASDQTFSEWVQRLNTKLHSS